MITSTPAPRNRARRTLFHDAQPGSRLCRARNAMPVCVSDGTEQADALFCHDAGRIIHASHNRASMSSFS
jgi:hypothetical protein